MVFHRLLVASAPSSPDETKLTPLLLTFFEIFRYADPSLSAIFDEIVQICVKNIDHYLPQFLAAFPLSTLFSDRDFRASIFAQFPCPPRDLLGRASCHWIVHYLLLDFFDRILKTLTDTNVGSYTACHSQITRLLLADSDDEAMSIKTLFVGRWSRLMNMLSRVIAGPVTSDLLPRLKTIFSKKATFQIFTLKLFAEIHFPKFDDTTSNSLCQFLNAIPTSRSAMNVTVAAMEFVRNLAGFSLQQGDGPAAALSRAVRHGISRIAKQNEYSFNSILVLFQTLGAQSVDFPLLFETLPNATFRIVDSLSGFCSILDGPLYLPPCEHDEFLFALEWSLSEHDPRLAAQLYDSLSTNSPRFGGCQRELASLFLRAAAPDPPRFLNDAFIPIFASDNFVMDNIDGVLHFLGRIFSQCGPFANPKLAEHVHRIINRVLSDNLPPVPPDRCVAFGTSPLGPDDAHLAEDATVLPLAPFDPCDITDDLTNLGIAWDMLPRESPSRLSLRTIERVDYTLTPVIRALSVFPYSSPTGQLLNRVAPLLFSPNAFLASVVLRALERLCHVRRDGQSLKALLTLRATTPESFYVFAYALLHVVGACASASVALPFELASAVCVWVVIFLSSPFPAIRGVALRLCARLQPPPDSVPDVCRFLEEHSGEIASRTARKLAGLSSMAMPRGAASLSFGRVVRCFG